MCLLSFYYMLWFFVFFFLMIRRPPRSTRTDTLFPYTTLFRSRVPHIEELVGGRNRAEDVQSAVAARLDPGLEPGLPQHLAQPVRRDDGLGEPRSLLRVEVDPQLDGVLGIRRERCPRVEHDRVHLRRPHRRRDLGEHERSEEHTSELQSLMRISYHDLF